MLNHIAFRPFSKEPARKNAIPFLIAAIQNNQLHKNAGFRIIFPWRGLLTSPQAHNHIARALRFTGLHGEFLHQPIAFVEQAQHRHPLRHGGHPLQRLAIGW